MSTSGSTIGGIDRRVVSSFGAKSAASARAFASSGPIEGSSFKLLGRLPDPLHNNLGVLLHLLSDRLRGVEPGFEVVDQLRVGLRAHVPPERDRLQPRPFGAGDRGADIRTSRATFTACADSVTWSSASA